MRIWSALSVSILLACSSSTTSSSAPVHCAIGELTGTWRIHYSVADGNCGQLADETIVLSAEAQSGAGASCTKNVFDISADKCRVDMDSKCPLADNSGTQEWVGAMHQVADDKLSGSLTVEALGSAGECRGTYDVTWTRQ